MIIGFDYWQVLSHYPAQFGEMIQAFAVANAEGSEHEVHVISAVGKNRVGTVESELFDLFLENGYESDVLFEHVHEVVFDNPSQSPELKLAKCKELGITMFFDDREDVCRLLNKNGIVALRVTRKDNSTYDLEAERK